MTYHVGETAFESRLVTPAEQHIRGGILFGPDWYGIYDYPLSEARRFARLGFAVFVVDLYGAGVRPTNDEEAGGIIGQLQADRGTVRTRMQAAHRQFASRLSPATKISAFGFSFGGLAVLELARAGAPLAGVVVLSGILDTPSPADAANIQSPVLVLHGTQDMIAPLESVVAFSRGMDAAQRSYRIQLFGGAAHAFTNAKFLHVLSGPLRFSAADAPIANAAAFEFLTALHPLPSAE